MRRRGVALATALFFTVFLLVLGLAFLTMIEQDYRLAGQQERSQRAYHLALAGLDYYKMRSGNFTPNVPQQFGLPQGDPCNRFEVVVETDGTIRSRGLVLNSAGQLKAERVLVVPQGNFSAMYDGK